MAFWGVEVKPGRPRTHKFAQARGRLRISQATMGYVDHLKEASSKSIVRCNVRFGSPILLCVLLPGKIESVHLDLEFDESDDVTFSVLGSRSVYLTGYYLCQNQKLSDIESYGVDIQNSPLGEYNFSDDKYGGSFINDEELSSDQGFDEVTPRKTRKGRGKLIKKKPMIIESDDVSSPKGCGKLIKKKPMIIESDDVSSPKNEDEDGFSVSQQEVLQVLKTRACDSGVNVAQEIVKMDDMANDDGVHGSETKQNIDPLDTVDKIERMTQSPLYEEGSEVNNLKSELPKQVGSSEKVMVFSEDEIRGGNTNEAPINQNLLMINGEDQIQSLDLVTKSPLDDEGADFNNAKHELPKQVGSSVKIMVSSEEVILESNTRDALINQNLPMINGEDQMQSLDPAKPKNKRKERSVTDKTNQVHDDEDPIVPRGHKELQIDSSTDSAVGEDHMVSPELDLENGQKSKKRRNELLEGEHTQVTDEKFQDKENLSKQDSLHADCVTEHLPVAIGESKLQKTEKTTTENFGLECQNAQEDEVIQEATNGEDQKDQTDRNMGTITEFQASDNKLGKKLKKKRKKTRGNQEDEGQSAVLVHPSNELIIEELESGSQGGKVAVPEKMVKICYTGVLKDSGHVFASNAISKFRLGDEEIIDGWKIGIDGMRVGGKRRLIIPPSMGFGERGSGRDIPPNSWLIYDIELVNVRRSK